MHAINTQAAELSDFDFQFHLEPYELDVLSNAGYCSFSDFTHLVSSDAQLSFKKFLWCQFRLHRAIDTLQKIDDLME